MENSETEKTIKSEYSPSPPLGISGLGGWLVLVQIGLYFTVVTGLINFFQYSLPALGTLNGGEFTSKSSEYYHVLWGPIIVFESLFGILNVLFIGYILMQFYQKRSILPRLMIIFYSASFLFGIIDYILLYQIPLLRENEDGSSITDLIRSFITCAIWISYFIRSKRVKHTFIR